MSMKLKIYTKKEEGQEEPKPKKKESQARAEKKYLQKFDDIKVRVPEGQRKIIKAKAEEKGMSLNAYIQDLIKKDTQ